MHRVTLLQQVDSRILEACLENAGHGFASRELDRTEVTALHVEHLEGAHSGFHTQFGRKSDGRAGRANSASRP